MLFVKQFIIQGRWICMQDTKVNAVGAEAGESQTHAVLFLRPQGGCQDRLCVLPLTQHNTNTKAPLPTQRHAAHSART